MKIKRCIFLKEHKINVYLVHTLTSSVDHLVISTTFAEEGKTVYVIYKEQGYSLIIGM